jgi:hypothetical protein
MVNDPIVLQSYWVSGGYLNIYFAIPVVSDSKVVHYINFEYEDNASEAEGTYTFHIRHDGTGEVFNESNQAKIQLAYAYASVPVSSIIKEKEARIILKWKSHKIMGNTILLTETEDVIREALYSKDAYQQTPDAASAGRRAFEIR